MSFFDIGASLNSLINQIDSVILPSIKTIPTYHHYQSLNKGRGGGREGGGGEVSNRDRQMLLLHLVTWRLSRRLNQAGAQRSLDQLKRHSTCNASTRKWALQQQKNCSQSMQYIHPTRPPSEEEGTQTNP